MSIPGRKPRSTKQHRRNRLRTKRKPDMELARRVVDYLNELKMFDSLAMAALVGIRVPCNKALALHPTCQVAEYYGSNVVGLLGVLNGLCGIDEETGFGPIAAVFEDGNQGLLDLTGFRIAPVFEEG